MDEGADATPRLRAVLFDVDGTLAETERDGHRPAFNAAFALHHLDIEWDPVEYGQLLTVTGGRRRIDGYLRRNGYGARSGALAEAVHRTKTELFREWVTEGELSARPGALELIDDLRRTGVWVGVATTGRRAWVEPLVTRLLGHSGTRVMITGDEVPELKPDPSVYLRALADLGCAADEALAVEDSAVGLRAARAAGLATVVVRNHYTADQDFAGAVEVRDEFDQPDQLSAARCVQLHRHAHPRRISAGAR